MSETTGRLSKLTSKVEETIVQAIRAGNYASVAAEYAGVSESTFYNWLRRGREESEGPFRSFHDAVRGAERESEVRAVAIVQKHMDGNWQAAMTFLERKHPERWGRRDQLRVEVSPGQDLAKMLGLSMDELEGAAEQAALAGRDRSDAG